MSAARNATWGHALLCCVLAFHVCADEAALFRSIAAAFAVVNAPDDDDDIVRSPRFRAAETTAHLPALPALVPVLFCLPPLPDPLPTAGRPGGEHARRNGVGVPLLC